MICWTLWQFRKVGGGEYVDELVDNAGGSNQDDTYEDIYENALNIIKLCNKVWI